MIKHVNIGLLAMLWHPVQSRTNLKVGELRHLLIKLCLLKNPTIVVDLINMSNKQF